MSQRPLDIIRANREAIRSGGSASYIEMNEYYNPRYAPTAESLVEHDRYGLGIVWGHLALFHPCSLHLV